MLFLPCSKICHETHASPAKLRKRSHTKSHEIPAFCLVVDLRSQEERRTGERTLDGLSGVASTLRVFFTSYRNIKIVKNDRNEILFFHLTTFLLTDLANPAPLTYNPAQSQNW